MSSSVAASLGLLNAHPMAGLFTTHISSALVLQLSEESSQCKLPCGFILMDTPCLSGSVLHLTQVAEDLCCSRLHQERPEAAVALGFSQLCQVTSHVRELQTKPCIVQSPASCIAHLAVTGFPLGCLLFLPVVNSLL